MTQAEAMMLAVTMGAAARMRPNNLTLKRTEVEAYQRLLELLESYGNVNARMMEVGPGSKDRQKLLADQIRQSGAARDTAVLRQSHQVLQEIARRDPHAITSVFADQATLSAAVAELEAALHPIPHRVKPERAMLAT